MLAAFAKFTRLRHLKLVYCNFASFGDPKMVVAVLPVLSSLTLTAVAWHDSADPDESLSAPAPIPTPLTLSRLSISTRYRVSQKPKMRCCCGCLPLSHPHDTSSRNFPSISATLAQLRG